MSNIIRNMGKSVKVLSVLGIMLGFAAMLGSASGASAATLGSTDPGILPVATAPGKLGVYAVDEIKGSPVADAALGIWDAKGNIVAKGYTNEAGFFAVKLAQGTYKVTIYAKGYETQSQTVQIAPGASITIKAALK